MDLAQSYPLPYSCFTDTTLFSLLLLLLLPSMPASEPTRLAADVAYVAEVKGFASRLTHVLKMCNHRRAWQRIRQTIDGSMTVGPMRHLVLSQSSLRAATRRWPHNHSPGPRCRPLASVPLLRHSAALCSMSTSFRSPKQQVDATLKVYIASLCFKCFRCFIGTLQVFYIDVAKVDQDVAYAVMVAHVF
jgi:hypothetical protein